MYTYPINFTGSTHFRIAKSYKNNMNKDFLYNEVSKVVTDLKLPANYGTDKIDIIFEDSKLQKNLIETFKNKLKEKAIQFKMVI